MRVPICSKTARPISAFGKQAALQRAFLDRAVDFAETDRLAHLHPRIEIFEHLAGLLAGLRRAFQRDMIAIRIGEHAKPPFDLGEVLIILAEEQWRRDDYRQTPE